MVVLILLIVLACFGIGLVGGVPIPAGAKREKKQGDKIEMVEEEKSEDEHAELG